MKELEVTEETVDRHAPPGWRKDITFGRLRKLVNDGTPVPMIVLAADIRSSTLLMRESLNLKVFADILTTFASAVSVKVRESGGWFDKFTGDGFLAYWLLPDGNQGSQYASALRVARAAVGTFRDAAEPDLLRNVGNAPGRMGLSVGLDAGSCALVMVAGDLTILGSAVVGATRMVDAAEPYETLANVAFGLRVEENSESALLSRVSLTPRMVGSKEHPKGQRAFTVSFNS